MELIAQKREIFGRAVKPLRAKGFVPAELYGRGLENLHLAVSKKELSKVFKQAGENGQLFIFFTKAVMDGYSFGGSREAPGINS